MKVQLEIPEGITIVRNELEVADFSFDLLTDRQVDLGESGTKQLRVLLEATARPILTFAIVQGSTRLDGCSLDEQGVVHFLERKG